MNGLNICFCVSVTVKQSSKHQKLQMIKIPLDKRAHGFFIPWDWLTWNFKVWTYQLHQTRIGILIIIGHWSTYPSQFMTCLCVFFFHKNSSWNTISSICIFCHSALHSSMFNKVGCCQICRLAESKMTFLLQKWRLLPHCWIVKIFDMKVRKYLADCIPAECDAAGVNCLQIDLSCVLFRLVFTCYLIRL